MVEAHVFCKSSLARAAGSEIPIKLNQGTVGAQLPPENVAVMEYPYRSGRLRTLPVQRALIHWLTLRATQWSGNLASRHVRTSVAHPRFSRVALFIVSWALAFMPAPPA